MSDIGTPTETTAVAVQLEPHFVHLGVPIPLQPITEGGQVIRRDRVDGGPAQLQIVLPQADVKSLIDNANVIEREIADRGHTPLVAHLLQNTVMNPASERWEIDARHFYSLITHHSYAGTSYLTTSDDTLRHVLALLAGTQDIGSQLHDAFIAAELEKYRWPEIEAEIHSSTPQAVKTWVGIGAMLEQLFTKSTQPAAFKYCALSTSATALTEAEREGVKLSTETSLPSEISGSEGLQRKEVSTATVFNTGGSVKPTCTVQVTFTVESTLGAEKIVAKVAYFNASSGGTMGMIDLLLSTFAMKAINDNATITNTVAAT